jgi:ABC-type enterobactin transport system permease subunit
MNLELFLMVVAVTLAIGTIAATPVSPVTIITPVMAQNMTVLNMTAGEMITGNTSDVVTVTG